jgi:hypothetical protein
MASHSSSLVRAAMWRSSAFELGEQLLDRVEIGAVGRQEEQGGAGRGERLAPTSTLG